MTIQHIQADFIMDLLKQVKAGEFGEITSVEAQMNCRHPAPVRKWLKNLKGGMMYFLGCHLIDLILQIQGTPENIIPLNKYSSNAEEGEVFGMAVFEYKNGVSFAKTTATEKGGFARRQLVVTGSKKTLEIKPLEMRSKPAGGSEIYTEMTEYTEYAWSDCGTKKRSENYDRYDFMMESFAKMVMGEIKNPNTPEYELELYKTVLKCCGIIK